MFTISRKPLLLLITCAVNFVFVNNLYTIFQVNNGVNHMTHASAAGDVSNDVDDDTSSKHSDLNIWDYRVTITVSLFLEL